MLGGRLWVLSVQVWMRDYYGFEPAECRRWLTHSYFAWCVYVTHNAERSTFLYHSVITLPPLHTVRMQLISISMLWAASFFFCWWTQPRSFLTFSIKDQVLGTDLQTFASLSGNTVHVYTTVVWNETEKCRWNCTAIKQANLSQRSLCCWDVYFLFCRKCMLGYSILHAATLHQFNTRSLWVTS